MFNGSLSAFWTEIGKLEVGGWVPVVDSTGLLLSEMVIETLYVVESGFVITQVAEPEAA
jgi:hypothetical protein